MFWIDVFTAACTGGDRALHYPFRRAFIGAAAVGGQIWVASYGDVEIAGVACWFPPCHALFSRFAVSSKRDMHRLC
jgi:hypothetical protein